MVPKVLRGYMAYIWRSELAPGHICICAGVGGMDTSVLVEDNGERCS